MLEDARAVYQLKHRHLTKFNYSFLLQILEFVNAETNVSVFGF